jgi:hypothetical protein
MPGPLYHFGASAICPHGGQVNTIPSNVRVLVSGMAVATVADQGLVAGCAFNVSGSPMPCVRVQWLVPATRVLVMGQPALLRTSTGLCFNPTQAPQGPPTIVSTQPRVIGM